MIKHFDSEKRIVAVLFAGMLVEFLLLWLVHVKVIFAGDDLWYATNLATGEAITGISDIWVSQKWHFMNWGGRSVIHFLLQLIIMLGDLVANIMNMLVTILLCFLICETAGIKSVMSFCLTFSLLISLNPNILYTIFWQSGCVNYLYASTWILLFVMIYLRQVKAPDACRLWGIHFWIVPLGLVTGWSNENMGPASFLLTVMVLFYYIKILKKKTFVWMWLGSVSSFVGSILVVAAPGNFVRSSLIEEYAFGMGLYQKILMMMKAGVDFLFPAVLFLLISLLIYLKAGNKLQPFQIMLLITTVLAYGAMVLSPTFPNRATFGILVLCITSTVSYLGKIRERDKNTGKYINVFAICMLIRAVYMLCIELQAPLAF